jgi:nucleotide-binding universal stress UspA family protein
MAMADTRTLVSAVETARRLSAEQRIALTSWLHGAGRAALHAEGVTDEQIGPPLAGVDRDGAGAAVTVLRRLLVPIDGSEQAERAIVLALAIARERMGRIIFCHIVRASDISALAGGIEDVVVALCDEAQALLAEAVDRARMEGVEAEAALAEGDFVEAILRLARERSADVIVMGTHGRRGLKPFVIGSLAEAVLNRSTIPVLVIRTP